MFEVYTAAIVVIIVVAVSWAVVRKNDTLHPLAYLMPMAGFFYVYVPARLYQKGALTDYFSLEEVTYVQGFNLVCLCALVLGCYWGGKGISRKPEKMDVFSFRSTDQSRRLVFAVGLTLGIIGVLGYVYQIANVGGFIAAYSTPKGGGWAESGYVRTLNLMCVPAIVLLYMAQGNGRMPLWHRVAVGAFSVPLLLHGLLSARRGPTFVALGTLVGGWYLVRRKRPSFRALMVGGGAIGLLLLILVAFRGQIYIGGSLLTGRGPAASEVVEESLERTTRTRLNNEFLYGTYIFWNAKEEAGHYWGARYLTQFFVRPIPSSLWPTKYVDVGMREITYNSGQLRTADPEQHPRVPAGAAPGFAASTYVEFGWAGPVFVLFLGWLYGRAWRKCLVEGGLWTLVYLALLSTSAFFVAQSFLAVLYRALLIIVPAAVLWRTMEVSPSRGQHRSPIPSRSEMKGPSPA